MSKIEELLQKTTEPKQVAKYFSLFSSQLEENEEIEHIEIEVSFTPKAIVFTNQRIVECKSKTLGTDIAIDFYCDWDSVKGLEAKEGLLSSDFIFNIGNSNLIYNCTGYQNSSIDYVIELVNIKINKDSENLTVQNTEEDYEQKLIKLKNLFDKSLINESEYNSKKSEIISKL